MISTLFLTSDGEIQTKTLLRNQTSAGHSGWQTTSDSPEAPLFQNPISQNPEQYYLCVCVYIYYIANEQIAAMWHGLVVWLVRKKKKKKKHTGLHTPMLTLQSPAACLPPSLCSPQFTHMHTQIYTHPTTRPPVFSACPSISSCRALGWEYLSSLC